MSFQDLPEELLERILSLAVVSPLHRSSPAPFPDRGRLAPLLVSRQLYRIGRPLFWHTLHLTSNAAVENTSVKVVVTHGFLPTALPPSIRVVDVTIPDTESDADVQTFITALSKLENVQHLIVRKRPTTYLTKPCARLFIQGLERAAVHWTDLESVFLAFRLSDSSPRVVSTLPTAVVPGGNSHGIFQSLLATLTTLPKMRSLSTHMPSVWNGVLLAFTPGNGRHILLVLPGAQEDPYPPSLSHSGSETSALRSLYLRSAAKYPDLMSMLRLVGNGNGTTRERAVTWVGNGTTRCPNENRK